MMKKSFCVVLILVLAASFASAALAEGEATKLKLQSDSKVVYIGHTLPLTLTGSPEGAALPAVTYSSSKEAVATVDQKGVVTGLKRGRTVIKAVSNQNPKVKASITIDVRIPPEEITLSAKNPVAATGKTLTVKAAFLPKNADNKKVTWSVSDEAIATVNQKGQVKALKPGQVTVTAVSQVDPAVSGSIVITTVQKAKKLTFLEDGASVTAGETLPLVLVGPSPQPQGAAFYGIEPEDTTDRSVTFKSSKPKVATVDENGVVTAVSGGTAVITATTADGSKKRDTIKITVIQPVTGVSLKKNEIRVGVGRSASLHAVLSPANATNKAMTWTSSDENIATVSGTGLKGTVKGKAWGQCVVTGVTADGGFMVSATVHVGSYKDAVRVEQVRIRNGKPYLSLKNVSNLTITQVRYSMRGFDVNKAAIPMSTKGDTSILKGTYDYPLEPGEKTVHGQFSFWHPTKYEGMAALDFKITGITTDTGFTYDIPEDSQKWYSYDAS